MFFRRIIAAALMLSAPLPQALAQGTFSFSTEVSPQSGSLDDDFIFSVVLEGSYSGGFPYLTGGEDFKLSLIGPQTSVNIINGTVEQRVAYRYRLIPKREGKLLTPAAEIEIDGEKYESEPLTVEITKSSAPRLAAQQDVFLKQTLSKESIFVGEQVVCSLGFFAAVPVFEAQLDPATFDGFWHESLGEAAKTSKIIEGREFDVTRIEDALFAIKPGKLSLAARTLNAKMRVRAQSSRRQPDPFSLDPFGSGIFDDFFGNARLKEVTLTSEEITLNVKALPEPPRDFPLWNTSTPLVGETSISLGANTGSIKAGESKTLTIEVQSTGNLNPLDKIDLKLSRDVKIYEESPESKTVRQGGLLVSKKTFRVSLVPLKGGQIVIPGIELGYFDPNEARYKVAKSRELAFDVIGETTAAEPVESFPGKESDTNGPPAPLPVSKPTHAAKPLKYEEATIVETLVDYVSVPFALLVFLAGLALIAAAYLAVRWNQSAQPRKDTQRLLTQTESLDDLRKTFRLALVNKLGLDADVLGADELRAQVRTKFKEVNLQFAIISLLDDLDLCSFGGKAADAAAVTALRQRALEVAKEW